MNGPFDNIIWTTSNKSKLLETLSIPHGFSGKALDFPKNVLLVKQVHQDKIILAADTSGEALEEADGLLTQAPGQIVGIQTADCVPVLISHPKFSAVLHCGWRGIVGGILESLVSKTIHFDLSQSVVVCGPAIFPPHYQVDKPVMEAFQSWSSKDNVKDFVTQDGVNRWQIDLQLAVMSFFLNRCSMKPSQLEVIRINTFSSPDYFSYRSEKLDTGRNISWMGYV